MSNATATTICPGEFYTATAAIYAYTAKGKPTPLTVEKQDWLDKAIGTWIWRPYVVIVHHADGLFAAAFACPVERDAFHRHIAGKIAA